MKKDKGYFLVVLVFLSALGGWLLSKISLVGKAGIAIAYKEYRFLKTWWQGALLILAVWLVLFFLLQYLQQRTKKFGLVLFTTTLLALTGLYFTYADFRNNLSHRWLGERFHLGAYLFWIGWPLVAGFFLWQRKKESTSLENQSS